MSGRLTFSDGPCAGKTETVPDSVLLTGSIQCGGVVYAIQGVRPGVYTATENPVRPTSPLLFAAPDFYSGYNDLRRSLVWKLWPALHTARRNDLAALRALSRRSKVRSK